MSTRSSRGSRPQNVLNTADDAIQKTRLNGAQEQGRAVEKSATSARSVGNELAQGILAQGELAQGEFADAEFAVPQAPSFDVPQSEATLSSGSRFPAFAHRNFRLFWAGNLISLIGTWAQQTAQGWLMRKMTPDPALIAGVAACGSIPILLLTLYAGAIADRVDKRRTLLWTNWASLVLAAVLGVLVGTGVVQIWHIATVAFCVGIVNAFDIPVRQSFNAEMVAREDLPNAIALNSSAFNAARVLGPATGGWLLHHLGIAGCFFANSLSFVALIFGLSRMKLADQKPIPLRRTRSRVLDLRCRLPDLCSAPTFGKVFVLCVATAFCGRLYCWWRGFQFLQCRSAACCRFSPKTFSVPMSAASRS